ncbi:MAG: NUDIX hydrolase [Gammaproteobacteria bacterium]|nr:NUDIX hydrolase [Gammaproteobacteria bacterium]
MNSRPRITVASVLERDGAFLLVEEHVQQRHVLNQPAGHLEQNERIVDAVVRETLEETRWQFRPTHLTGIYRWTNTQANITYVRFCFTGELLDYVADRQLDQGIIRALWYTPAQLQASTIPARSPLVARCIEDYRRGQRYDLDLITEIA